MDSREGITSWEFQLRIAKDRNASLSRAEWEQYVEQSFATVHSRLPDVSIQPLSRRTMVWHEVERAVSTGDGKPLDKAAQREGVEYPFTQIGVLR